MHTARVARSIQTREEDWFSSRPSRPFFATFAVKRFCLLVWIGLALRAQSRPVFRAYPSQASTGNRGYFGNRESVKESSHITNTEPRSDSIRRACWQSAHKPAFVLSKLSLPVTDFARPTPPESGPESLPLRPLARPGRIKRPADAGP